MSVGAWNVDDADEADTENKVGKAIDVSGWSDFLDAHLERSSAGAFVWENGSYVDRTNGSNAFFGVIGSNHHYLSWLQATERERASDSLTLPFSFHGDFGRRLGRRHAVVVDASDRRRAHLTLLDQKIARRFRQCHRWRP